MCHDWKSGYLQSTMTSQHRISLICQCCAIDTSSATGAETRGQFPPSTLCNNSKLLPVRLTELFWVAGIKKDARRLRDVQRGIPLREGTSSKRPNAAQRSLSGAAVAPEAVMLIAKGMCTTL